MIPEPSLGLALSFWSMTLLVASSLPIAVWRATKDRTKTIQALIIVVTWVVFTGALTKWSGFRSFELPPPFVIVVNFGILGVAAMVFSSWGKDIVSGLSLAGLVLFQSFRFPLEVFMHRAYTEGLMPIQMSFEGRNLDILTGLSALILGSLLLKFRVPSWLVSLWNAIGFALLLNIVGVAILSAPTPWRKFLNEPPNIWVLDIPFVWLPMVMVLAAFFGHLAVARKLYMDR